MPRRICWFSCGAASAVATKLTLAAHPDAVIAYCHVIEEHPDNGRFLRECEEWFGRRVQVLRADKYGGSIYEVFRQRRYLGGHRGAPCTLLLKKEVRRQFERPDDVHIFGYTSEEQGRVDRFIDANPETLIETPLLDQGLGKADCLSMVARAGIELPAMYRLGYQNNNCVGCVKGGAGYWNKIRRDFPSRFADMARTERLIGYALCRVRGQRTFLDELPEDAGNPVKDAPPSCSFNCELIELESLAEARKRDE